jgi:hypothetical protein
MPFIDIFDESGKKTGLAHINIGGRKWDYCKFCLREGNRVLSGKLCDFVVSSPQVVTHKRTCDAPMCDKHAQSIGPDLDHCPDHAKQGEMFPKEPSI